MKANAVALLDIFEKKVRLEVPLFQRQYVWSQAQQWEPLWEDISRKFSEHLEGRQDAPVHFLGAMVLDQKQTPTTHVERRQVIDGQQRLTTLQIFLAAFRDFCSVQSCSELALECEGYTLNKGMMANPETDKFKVWPTTTDRTVFSDVILSQSLNELLRRYPLVTRKFARRPDPRPRMVESYIFFHKSLSDYFLGALNDPPLCADIDIATRLEECFKALKDSILVVAIDLEPGDDAQVIFETLNARGEPLLPADLLRNYIFLRAARRGEAQEALYEKYWKPFDDPFWRKEIRQGRLNRPRSDMFIQHFLASRQCVDVPMKHLFVEYKFWIERSAPFETVEEELKTLKRQGDDFSRILSPKDSDPIYDLSTFLAAFDVSTIYPLLLWIMDSGVSDEEWLKIATVLESYIIRRAICGLTNKNYNRIFLRLIQNAQKSGPANASVLASYLAQQTGESSVWPTDRQVSEQWRTAHAYSRLANSRMVYILKKLSNTYLSNKTEELHIDSSMSVEHILPQRWQDNWPLPDGSTGLNMLEVYTTAASDPRAVATKIRNTAVQTFGNLTIVTQPLNSSVSNAAWKVKKPELLKHSLLPVNQQLHAYVEWNEETIAARAEELLSVALSIWPHSDLAV